MKFLEIVLCLLSCFIVIFGESKPVKNEPKLPSVSPPNAPSSNTSTNEQESPSKPFEIASAVDVIPSTEASAPETTTLSTIAASSTVSNNNNITNAPIGPEKTVGTTAIKSPEALQNPTNDIKLPTPETTTPSTTTETTTISSTTQSTTLPATTTTEATTTTTITPETTQSTTSSPTQSTTPSTTTEITTPSTTTPSTTTQSTTPSTTTETTTPSTTTPSTTTQSTTPLTTTETTTTTITPETTTLKSTETTTVEITSKQVETANDVDANSTIKSNTETSTVSTKSTFITTEGSNKSILSNQSDTKNVETAEAKDDKIVSINKEIPRPAETQFNKHINEVLNNLPKQVEYPKQAIPNFKFTFKPVEVTTYSTIPESQVSAYCPSDVLFVLDSTGSVSQVYEDQKAYIVELVEHLNIGQENQHVNSLPFFGGVTATGSALNLTLKALEARRADKKTLVVVLTDGFSFDNTQTTSEALHRLGNVQVIVTGKPLHTVREVLNEIAGDPSRVLLGEQNKASVIKILGC